MDPTFALTLEEIRHKFLGINKISKDSTLILKGLHGSVENLNLHGVAHVNNDKLSGEIHNE